MSFFSSRTLALAFAAAGLAALAPAQNLGLANEFNAFVFESATLNGGHADGAVAVGGNISGSGYDFLQKNDPATVAIFSQVGLYAGGNVSLSNNGSINNSGTGHVNGNFSTGNPFNVNGGTLFVGGSISGPVNGSKQAGNDTVNEGLFGQQKAYSLAQTAAIRGLSGTTVVGSGPAWPNVLTIDLNSIATNPDGQKVVKMDKSVLGNPNAVLNLTNQGNETVIMDILGGGSLDWSWTVNTSNASKLLWNFKDLQAISLNRTLTGSVLAPNAVVTQNTGNIQGNLIARSWINNNSNELHFGNQYTFTGTAPVPEPATMVLLGGAAAAFLARRRRKA
ncbi:MAG: choice-of-anchor A family protein [Fimbriimonadaceae bacterium]|nr:choice-of-anchor A family protein [Fimbriimonadaceae bacterium]